MYVESTHLFAKSHSLETLKVVQISPLRTLRSGLRESTFIPLVLHTSGVPLLLQRSLANRARYFDFDGCECETGESSRVTGNGLGGVV